MIQAEGVESLSEAELRQACRDRGLLGLLSVEEMRQQVNAQSCYYILFLETLNRNQAMYHLCKKFLGLYPKV